MRLQAQLCVCVCAYFRVCDYMPVCLVYACTSAYAFTGAMFLAPGRETDSTCATRGSPLHGPALVFCPVRGPLWVNVAWGGGGQHVCRVLYCIVSK